MSIQALLEVKSRLSNFTDLNDYFDTQYGKQPRHFIGYKKIVNSMLLPSVCYVPMDGKRNSNDSEETLAIVIQIENKTQTDDAFNGVIEVNEIADLIIESFTTNLILTTDFLIDKAIEVKNGYADTPPFYEIAIIITVKNSYNSRAKPFGKNTDR